MNKRLLLFSFLTAILLTTSPSGAGEETNDFYDDEDIIRLEGNRKIRVEGEVAEPTTVDISLLPKRTVIVKEAVLDAERTRFRGAYLYEGVSLYDILNGIKIEKINKEEFDLIIDLFVRISNEDGDYTILSWGEIYYPVHRHEIIIATEVSPIVPTKSKEIWPIPEETRLIAAADLITARNIDGPTTIAILSVPRSFDVDRDISLYSDELSLIKNSDLIDDSIDPYTEASALEYPAVFYGRGRGIHGITYFRGIPLSKILSRVYPLSEENLKRGLFVISAVDGYRCSFSYSEIMNRNDQSEILLIESENEEGGRFRMFASPDFFSDRAVKSVNAIEMMTVQ